MDLRRLPLLAATALVPAAVACGAHDRASAASDEARDTAAVAPAPDTATPSMKTGGVKHVTAAPRRDSAFGPKLEVDSTGKVKPIKKP